MRKASYVLGMVGGCLALVGAVLYIVGGLFIVFTGTLFFDEIMAIINNFVNLPGGSTNWINTFVIGMGGVLIVVLGVLCAVAGILGLVGARKIEKNNVKAGVLMLVAAGLSLIAGFGFFLMILFLLGGIFALVKEKSPEPPEQPQ